MKKIYIHPEIEVDSINIESHILAASTGTMNIDTISGSGNGLSNDAKRGIFGSDDASGSDPFGWDSDE